MNAKKYITITLILTYISYFNVAVSERTEIDIERQNYNISNNNTKYIDKSELIDKISRDWILYQRSLNNISKSNCLAY